MRSHKPLVRLTALAAVLLVAACQDSFEVTAPQDDALQLQQSQSPHGIPAVRGWEAVPEVMALAHTVFAAVDEVDNAIVIGISNVNAMYGVHRVMEQLGVPATSYRVEMTEPIEFMNLRSRHRPTVGGIQIHWGNYVCTLGFNVDHANGRSFITNSHCTNKQGTTGTTLYYQPLSSVDSSPIAQEAHDPAYFKGGACSVGKVCRYSDSSRALYDAGTSSSRGVIARTTGENNGDLNVAGSFTVASQDNSNDTFSGTVHKVGRTTGWTSGNVTNSCATVNVSGSNIQLLCQTLVQRSGTTIVQGGDSGSPVFTHSSGDNVTLIGILWGGNSSGDLFVFSPLKGIQSELGSLVATADGSGGGNGGGGGGEDEAPCVPRGPNGNNCK
jgi:V8-like Glu-specific endopeptidase